MADNRPIGVFDSGVGGLTILREIEHLLPHENLLYFADTANIPYGIKEPAEIARLSLAVSEFLISQRAKLIVVACNTASVASLSYLRERLPVPFVGIVPAIKPAAAASSRKRIGVMATDTTLASAILDSLVEKFASDTIVIRQECPGLVEMVERGQVDGPETESQLRRYIDPLLANQIDTLVLGCTHYPFLRDAIQAIVGEDIAVIDPAPAVARQVARVLESNGLTAARRRRGRTRFFTSGDERVLASQLSKLTGSPRAKAQRVLLTGEKRGSD
ncbi:MAG: glutamate racemase [Chloroflexi bacterium]|nr:glutamate racemase [Chloroflexota bacterium]